MYALKPWISHDWFQSSRLDGLRVDQREPVALESIAGAGCFALVEGPVEGASQRVLGDGFAEAFGVEAFGSPVGGAADAIVGAVAGEWAASGVAASAPGSEAYWDGSGRCSKWMSPQPVSHATRGVVPCVPCGVPRSAHGARLWGLALGRLGGLASDLMIERSACRSGAIPASGGTSR